jgi:hypothetical protein
MGKYNEELVKAGVLLDLSGHPTAEGARVKFSGGKRTVVDGPFTESKELVRGLLDHRSEVQDGGHRLGEAGAVRGRRRSRVRPGGRPGG